MSVGLEPRLRSFVDTEELNHLNQEAKTIFMNPGAGHHVHTDPVGLAPSVERNECAAHLPQQRQNATRSDSSTTHRRWGECAERADRSRDRYLAVPWGDVAGPA